MRCDRAKEEARVAGAERTTAVPAFERAAFSTEGLGASDGFGMIS